MRLSLPRPDLRPLLHVALALTLALGAAACGGSDDGDADPAAERQRARATVEKLYEEIAKMNAEGVCEQMSEEAQEQIAAGGLGTEADSCAEGYQGFFDEAEEAGGLEATLKANVRGVEIDGDEAIAKVAFGGPGRVGDIPLVKVDGEWKLAPAGARPSGSQ